MQYYGDLAGSCMHALRYIYPVPFLPSQHETAVILVVCYEAYRRVGGTIGGAGWAKVYTDITV